jgi:hypothetical protein
MKNKPINAGKSWTLEEEQLLIEHVQKYDNDIENIAELHGRSAIALNMRIDIIIRKMINEGQSKQKIAKLFRKTDDDINMILSNTSSQNQNNYENKSHDTNQKKLQDIENLLMKIMKKLKKIEMKIEKL